MHARSITSSSTEIISNLTASVESLFKEFQQITLSATDLHDANSLEQLEIALHEKATKLADITAAVKLQETLNSMDEAEKELIKSHPKKNEKYGTPHSNHTHVRWYAC